MKIFIIESPSPNDLLDGVNERNSLENMCKMFDHKSTSFTTYSKSDLEKIVQYISGIVLKSEDLLCIHFSCHGNTRGVGIGSDFIFWVDFIEILLPILKNINVGPKTIITLSSCGANGQEITKNINLLMNKVKTSLSPPRYFLVSNQEEIEWRDALLCWTILYHQLGEMKGLTKSDLQSIIKRMNESGYGNLKYYRWDSSYKKYLKFENNYT